MNIRNFALSFYGNAMNGVHIQKIEYPREARELHSHFYYQIYYVERGELTHYVESYSTKLLAGDVFIIPPGVVHKIANNDEVSFYSLSFMPEIVDEIYHTAEFAASFLQKMATETIIRPKITAPPSEQLRIKRIIEDIFFEFEHQFSAAAESIKHYIAILVTLLARIYIDSADESLHTDDKSKSHLILYCMDYIKLNYFKKITLNDILRISTMSKSEFCKNFRKMAGYTFNEYLNQIRIRKACELIKNDNKISTICLFCGYEDSSTFYRNFVKIMGVSPAKYKKLNKSKT